MNNIRADQFIQQGWECPKCGAILAPHQNYCPFCTKSVSTFGSGCGKYVNPNPSKTIAETGTTTTNAKDTAVVLTLKSGSQDIAVF